METLKNILVIFAVGLTFSPSAFAQNNTPKYWSCEGKQGGVWGEYGRLPSVCRVKTFQNESEVEKYWSPVVFDDGESRTSERKRYMTEMKSFIDDYAQAYLRKRKPAVPQAEASAWAEGVLALITRESFWSHYRKGTDNLVRMMRGDFGHGHGMMQVDDRWHFVHIKDGGGARIEDNLIYAFDLIYKEWENAAKASCVSSPTNYISRMRAMYSAYNGGTSQLCRWTNPNHKWARNDKGFYDSYKNPTWKQYLTSDKTAEFNHNCLVQGGGLKCFDSKPVVVEPTPTPNPKPVEESKTVSIGDFIEPQVNINIRKTPGGRLISTLQAKEYVYQVLDTYKSSKGIIYYLISSPKYGTGYIYSGTESSSSQYTKKYFGSKGAKHIATKDDRITVVAAYGVNLRETAGGRYITRVPKSERLDIIERVVSGDDKDVYYKVEYKGAVGFIYSGHLTPVPNTMTWTEVN